MNTLQIKQAKALLSPQCDRFETAIDGDGQSLTAHFLDGSGQKLFATIEEVEAWRDERLEKLAAHAT